MGWMTVTKDQRTPSQYFKDHWNSEYITVLDTAMVNFRELYTVCEVTENNKIERFAMVVLLKFWNDEMAYKDMDESSHPYYYNAPKKLMKLLDGFAPANDNAKTWREKVWDNLNSKKENKKLLSELLGTIKQNDPIFSTQGTQFVYRGLYRKNFILIARPEFDTIYRLNKNKIDVKKTLDNLKH